VAELGDTIGFVKAHVAERLERAAVELLARGEVGSTDADVVDHAPKPAIVVWQHNLAAFTVTLSLQRLSL
jgi:hypothetical protein